jgi:hypothetical protein
MQKHIQFVENFEHVNFAINGKYSRKHHENPNYHASLLIFQTHKNTIIIKECPGFVSMTPLTMFLPDCG